MAEDQNRKENLDLNEIDELPDVVLGEKTRAMRVIRNQPDEDSEQKSSGKDNPAVKETEENEDSIEQKLTEAMKEETSAVEEEHSDEMSSGTVPESQQENTEEYHNDNEDDDEIPPSVIDDDPRVDNELDEALQPKKSSHDETDPLPPVSDELSKVYAGKDETAVTGRHAAHTHTEKMETEDSRKGTASVPVSHPLEHAEKTDPVQTDTEPKKKRRKHRTPLNQRIVTVILIILLILLGIGIYRIYDSLQPVSDASAPVSFQVSDGETIRQVSDSLAKQGIIKNADTGYYYARFRHLTQVKRGVFQLDKSWSLQKVFSTLNDEKAADQDGVIVTLTEGDWAKDMADKIAAGTNVKADDLMALWNNDDYIRNTLMPKYPFLTSDIFNPNIKCDLEGYLAPDTYTFNKKTTAQEVTAKILDQTNAVYQKHADQIQKSGYSIHQIYTLASIVQGESSREDQMKKIAGVFYNRLKQDMPLQSSVTTCYIIDFDKGKTDWQECEASYNTQKKDPYNTYLNKGLPPGPVQNAGETAINAVLNPDHNDDLFFMADVCGNTGIHYAKTEAEHEANVSKYNTCN